jgi:OOP family OmpA-OmpF porin
MLLNYSYTYALAGLITLVVGAWGFFIIRDQHRWNAAVENLSAQPGIAITKAEHDNGRYIINGMRDPLAVDPNEILRKYHINAKFVNSKWIPFVSLESEFVVKRAQQLLKPPKSVSLSFEDGTGTLTATGSAPIKWILETQRTWRFIPGVIQYQENNLVDSSLEKLNTYRKQLEQRILLFKNGSTDLLSSETSELQKIASEVKRLLEVADSFGKDVKIQIIGHTSITGGEERNKQLSQQRASKVEDFLVSEGINKANLKIISVGSNQSTNKQDMTRARRISLKIFIENLE